MSRRLLLKCIALAICLAILAPMLRADMLAIGTWVRRPNKDGGSSTMVIEAAGTGRKLTFKVAVAGGGTATMIVTTQLDGKDAPVSVDGKPSGETMAIRLIDDRHAINVIKMNGNPMLTQKSELSADGKAIKVESTPMIPGGQYGTEYWDKK
jgi:hypothetical protein